VVFPLGKCTQSNRTRRSLRQKKKDFVTLVDAHGKEHTINVRANGEKLELGAIGEIELQAVTGSGSGRTLLASLMALWRVLRARMNKGGW